MKKLINYVFLLMVSLVVTGCFPSGASSLTEKIEKQQISVYKVNGCQVSDPNILEEAGQDICTRLADRIGFELLKYKIFEKIPDTATRYIVINIEYYYDPIFSGILFKIYRAATDNPAGIKVGIDVYEVGNETKLTTLNSKIELNEFLHALGAQRQPNKSQLINLVAKEIAKSLSNM